MEFRADLHCHSTCSDGTLTPEELIHLAKKMGLSALSITDHDTVEAYETNVFDIARDFEISLKVGVEFSSAHEKHNIHILGYSFPHNNPLIKQFCTEHQSRRQNRNRNILDKLKAHNMPIDENELAAYGTVGRPHIAEQMILKGYVKNYREAFDKYIGDYQPCYDAGESFSVQETIDIIHQAGGKAFFAHPIFVRSPQVVEQLLSLGFDGIECYYGMMKYDQKLKWVEMAKKHNLLISGGSDFHGSLTPDILLGMSWVDQHDYSLI